MWPNARRSPFPRSSSARSTGKPAAPVTATAKHADGRQPLGHMVPALPSRTADACSHGGRADRSRIRFCEPRRNRAAGRGLPCPKRTEAHECGDRRDGQKARHYSTVGLPVTLFIGRDGLLRYTHFGEISPEVLLREIACPWSDPAHSSRRTGPPQTRGPGFRRNMTGVGARDRPPRTRSDPPSRDRGAATRSMCRRHVIKQHAADVPDQAQGPARDHQTADDAQQRVHPVPAAKAAHDQRGDGDLDAFRTR